VPATDEPAAPDVPAQRVFDRIEPVFTSPPDGPSLADATTFADAPAILPTLRPPAEPVIPQQRVPEEGPTYAVLPPPGPMAEPPSYPAPQDYPAYQSPQPSYPGYQNPQPGYPNPQGFQSPPPAYPAPQPGYAGQPRYPGQPGYPQPQSFQGYPGYQQPSAPGYQQPSYPGYPQPGGYGAPPGGPGTPGIPGWPAMPSPPPPPQPRKKRTGRNIVIAVISAAVLLGMPGVAVALTAPPSPSKPITLPKLPEPVDTTKVGDTTRDRATVMSRGMAKVLAAQEKAMADRDEATFLKAVATPAATSALRLRFRNLSAMKVAEYHLSASFPEADRTRGRWKSTLSIEFCFGKPGCSRDLVKESAVWQDTAGGPQLVSLGIQPVGEDWFEQPQPWEQTPLIAAVGQRVVVAMPSSLRSRLSTVLKEAEKAAVYADSYAVGTKPDFYRIYVANTREWRTWFGNSPNKWVAGYTTATGNNHGDVVINTAEAPNSYLPTMLRHEMTHAASTYGKHYSRDLWWVIEGYAQLAEPPMKANLKTFVRGYIRNTWNGRLPASQPSASASASTVSGQYGVAFAAVSYLQRKYGKAAVVDFFSKTVRNGLSMESASQDVFHASWSSVQSATLKAVRGF